MAVSAYLSGQRYPSPQRTQRKSREKKLTDEPLNTLSQMDNVDSFNAKIDAIGAVNVEAIVRDRQRYFRLYQEASFFKLMDQTAVICALQETGSKRGMYAHCATDDRLSYFVYFHVLCLFSESSVVKDRATKIAGVAL
jgi:hypothetical protein